MNGKPGDEAPPEKTPTEKILDEVPKEFRPHLKVVMGIYDTQLNQKDQEISTLRKDKYTLQKSADDYKKMVDTATKDVKQANEKAREAERAADKWYKKWPAQVAGGLAFFMLGALGAYELIPGNTNAPCTKCPGYESSIKTLQNEKNALNAENDGYKTKLAQSEKLISNLSKNRSDVDELRKAGAVSDTMITDLRKEINKLNQAGAVSNTCIANLTKDSKKIANERDAIAKEHEKCKDRIFVDVENRGDGLTQKLETMRPYLKLLAKEFGYDEYEMGEILVNIDADYDGKITKKEQMPVDFYFRKGYKYVFGVVTTDGVQKASDLGIRACTLNFADNNFPAYDESDSETRSAIKSAKSEINETNTRTVFPRTAFKYLCDKAGAESLIVDEGVVIGYKGVNIIAFWNEPATKKDGLQYYDVNRLIEQIKFEGWGEKECLKALKDYFSSVAPQKE